MRALILGLIAVASALVGWAEVHVAVPAIPASVFAERRVHLLRELGEGALVVRGMPTPTDLRRPFRQSSDFYYLTGVRLEDATLVLWHAGGTDHEILFLPRSNARRARFTGSGIPAGCLGASGPFAPALVEAELDSGFESIVATDELEMAIAERVPATLRVWSLDGEGRGDARPLLDRLRVQKSPLEVARIEEAVAVTTAAILDGLATVEPGAWEFEVEATIEHGFRRRGAAGPAFPSIVASGPNACVLHYQEGARRIEAGDLVVIDVGAEYGMYAADVTRTVPASGRFTDRQREIYGAVLEARRAALARVKPGATLRADVHGAAVEALERRGLAGYLPHATAHHLGLDVHDGAGADLPLRPGMVIAVEPGVYIPEESIGIRIEDDVLVTVDGCRVLSSDLPVTAEAIEELVAPRAGGGGR